MKTKAWYRNMVLVEFPRADQFAIDAAAQFGLRLEDIGHGLVRAYADIKLAAAFRAYCA